MIDQTTNQTNNNDNLEQVVHDITRIGRTWARMGLGVGRSSLEASAVTLRTTADLLGRISNHFEATPEVVDPAEDVDAIDVVAENPTKE